MLNLLHKKCKLWGVRTWSNAKKCKRNLWRLPYDFVGVHEFSSRLTTFFKLPALGIEPLTLGLQFQRSPPYTTGDSTFRYYSCFQKDWAWVFDDHFQSLLVVCARVTCSSCSRAYLPSVFFRFIALAQPSIIQTFFLCYYRSTNSKALVNAVFGSWKNVYNEIGNSL